MELTARQSIDAPPRAVWNTLKRLPEFEQNLRNRGVDLKRVEDRDPVAAGITWHGGFEYAGVQRDATAELVTFDPKKCIALKGSSKGLDGTTTVELTPEGEGTVLSVTVVLDSRNLPARMLLQTLKLARGKLQSRLEKMTANLGTRIEKGYARAQAKAQAKAK